MEGFKDVWIPEKIHDEIATIKISSKEGIKDITAELLTIGLIHYKKGERVKK